MNRRRVAGIVGTVAIVLSIVYLAWPVGHVPPYDANLVRLAESELQGYCAGRTYWNHGEENADAARRCRQELATQHSDQPSMTAVLPAFCQAVVDEGWTEGVVSDCIDILQSFKYWPTYDGGVTDAWNRARPYPQASIPASPKPRDDSRTGGRQGGDREAPPSRVGGWGP